MASTIAYGYTLSKGKLVIDEKESEVVKIIFEMFIYQNKKKAQIMRFLNEHGYRYRTGEKWYFALIHNILNNRKYCGAYGYPNIITEQEFELVNSKIVKIHEVNQRKNQIINTGQIFNKYHKKILCGECGNLYVRSTRAGMREMWVCKNSFHDECNARFISEYELDCLTVHLIRQVIKNTNLVSENSKKNRYSSRIKTLKYNVPSKEFIDQLSGEISKAIGFVKHYDISDQLLIYIHENIFKKEELDMWVDALIKNIKIYANGDIEYVFKNDVTIKCSYGMEVVK